MLQVNIWLREEVHYLQCVFMWVSLFTRGAVGTLPQNVFSEILKSNNSTAFAGCYFLLSHLSQCFCEVLWTLWALFILVIVAVVCQIFQFNSLNMDSIREHTATGISNTNTMWVIGCFQLFVWMRALSRTCSRHVPKNGRQIWHQLSRGASHKVHPLIWFDLIIPDVCRT